MHNYWAYVPLQSKAIQKACISFCVRCACIYLFLSLSFVITHLFPFINFISRTLLLISSLYVLLIYCLHLLSVLLIRKCLLLYHRASLYNRNIQTVFLWFLDFLFYPSFTFIWFLMIRFRTLSLLVLFTFSLRNRISIGPNFHRVTLLCPNSTVIC